MAVFLRILPPGHLRIYQNQLLISKLDEIHINESFAVSLICLCEQNCIEFPQNAIFGHFGGVFDKVDPWKPIFEKKKKKKTKEKKCQICEVSLYVSMSVMLHVKPMSISEDISMLTKIHSPISPMEPS